MQKERRANSNNRKSVNKRKNSSNISRNVEQSRTYTNIAKLTSLQARNKMDMPLVIVVLILISLGIVMVLSASAPSALADYGNSYHYVITQGIAAILGIIAMIVLSKVDYRIYQKFYWWIYAFSILIIFSVLIPGVGMEVSGARRWIKLGFQIQPSEITKIGLIISLAGYFSDKKNKLDNFWKGCFIPLIMAAVPIFLLYKIQNHLSAGIIIAMVTVIMIIISGCKLRYLFSLAGVGITGLAGVLILLRDKLSSSFRSDRVMAWLNPWEDTSGTSYQTVQGLYAIGSGELFGVGLGESKQKYLYIPEAHNDFIFAILAEELGFVGCLLVIALFAILVVRGVLIAIKSEDTFGSLVAIRNNCFNCSSSYFKYCSCNKYNTKHRNFTSIFKLWRKFINHFIVMYRSIT